MRWSPPNASERGFFGHSPDHEAPYFLAVGGAAVLFGVPLWVVTPGITRLMSGVR